MIEYARTKLSHEEIFNYFIENKKIFNPPLETRLNVKEYSLKLYKYATHFCAYSDRKLIGLIACYFNEKDTITGFISSVSVKREYHGSGIFAELINQVINYGKLNNFRKIKLEVRPENRQVLQMYKKFGFAEIGRPDNDLIMMELNLMAL